MSVVGADGTSAVALLDDFGSGAVPTLAMRRARGTAAAPTAVQGGDPLGNIAIYGRGATTYSAAPRVFFQGQAAENWTDTAQGANIYLYGTIPGGTTLAALATFSGLQGSQLLGTTTNDNAQAGWVGEEVFAANGGGVAMAAQTGTAGTNLATLALTAGDWDVQGQIMLRPTGTATGGIGSVNSASGTIAAPFSSDASTYSSVGVSFSTDTYFNLPSVRISIPNTQNVYLVGQLQGVGGTGFGIMRARRRR